MQYAITYDTNATCTYVVQAANAEEAHRKWQEAGFFDFDRSDFAPDAANTEDVTLVRLEMLDYARNFRVDPF